jgi:uncharacterized protein (DUF169 family)
VDIKQVDEVLTSYIRPQTFPVAIKMAKSANEVPLKARRPKRDLGCPMPVCQVITIARRYGWIMAMGKEDMWCPLAAIGLGFAPAKAKFLDGSFSIPVWGAEDRETRTKLVQALPRFDYGKYSYIVATPLSRTDFEPQVIVIYGNPAQIVRLGQSAILAKGSPIKCEFIGGFACVNYIAKPILTNECQFILSGGGERIFASVQKDEMAFAIPMSKVEEIIKQLKIIHKYGEGVPTLPFIRYKPDSPSAFSELWDYLNQPE